MGLEEFLGWSLQVLSPPDWWCVQLSLGLALLCLVSAYVRFFAPVVVFCQLTFCSHTSFLRSLLVNGNCTLLFPSCHPPVFIYMR